MDDEEVNNTHKYNHKTAVMRQENTKKKQMSKHTPKIPPEAKNTWYEMK